MKILILEDDMERVEQFHKNLQPHTLFFTDRTGDAIHLLKTQKWDVLFLDHDLGGQVYQESGPGTGYEVAGFLEQNPDLMPPNIVIHSLNFPGAEKMAQALRWKATRFPFAWTKKAAEIFPFLKNEEKSK
jgi:CheY-like chemotaxis protein